ncbi:MAG: arginine--tRNA ligase [Clostridiales bacterium]|jgi:arginyl-tRNA synthetase|nr:arginine--tRNA ligase [Clostridiales bacterium]
MDYKLVIAGLIADAAGLDGLDRETAHGFMEIPPDRAMGDYALPCFRLSRLLRRAPQQIAEELRQKLDAKARAPEYSLISGCEVAGGYLNVFVNKAEYIGAIMRGIMRNPERYGASDIGSGKRVLVEFSSPNIAKPFHIGHMFSTVVGNAIERIYGFLGYETVALNHVGDWGTQFGKLISAYMRLGDADALENDAIAELLRVYVLFHKEAKARPELDDEARGYFLQLERGEPQVKALWQKFRDLSIKEFGKVYRRLGVKFDSYAGESFYSDKMGEVVAALERKGLLSDSEGAKIVDLSAQNLQPMIIIKSDGATIYATRDLAAAIYRKREYDFYRNIYVVGIPQSLHFRQVFATLGLMGYEWSRDCVHIGFGLVKFPDRQMATREGEVIFLDDVLNESVRRAAQLMDAERGVAEPEKVAELVGIGAIVYTFLKNGRERDIVFSWDEMLDLEGDSGPYVQYTYARASSVLRKAGASAAGTAAAGASLPAGAGSAAGTEAGAASGLEASAPVSEAGAAPGLEADTAGSDASAPVSETSAAGSEASAAPGSEAGAAPAAAQSEPDYALLSEPEEYALAVLLNGFSEAILDAAQKYEPSILARHVAAIARAFNKFYHFHKILDAPPGLREARLQLCRASRALIGTGLSLLGIAAPEQM